MTLFLQVTPPTSGDFWNPSNWSWLGGDKFLLILFGGVVAAFAWRFLARGLDKWDKHLSRQEALTSSQLTLCRQVHGEGGTSNLTDFRDAGHDLVDVLQDLGTGISPQTGEKIKPKIDEIHRRLRNSPPPLPLPTVNLNANGD